MVQPVFFTSFESCAHLATWLTWSGQKSLSNLSIWDLDAGVCWWLHATHHRETTWHANFYFYECSIEKYNKNTKYLNTISLFLKKNNNASCRPINTVSLLQFCWSMESTEMGQLSTWIWCKNTEKSLNSIHQIHPPPYWYQKFTTTSTRKCHHSLGIPGSLTSVARSLGTLQKNTKETKRLWIQISNHLTKTKTKTLKNKANQLIQSECMIASR